MGCTMTCITMTFGNQYSAAVLFDGGWRSSDKEQFMTEYDLTEVEAEGICNELREYEEEKC